MTLAHWWKRLNDSREPSPAELVEQFAGLPADPRTGYPVGYVSFAVELDQRRAERIERARAALDCSRVSESNREFINQLRERAQASIGGKR